MAKSSCAKMQLADLVPSCGCSSPQIDVSIARTIFSWLQGGLDCYSSAFSFMCFGNSISCIHLLQAPLQGQGQCFGVYVICSDV